MAAGSASDRVVKVGYVPNSSRASAAFVAPRLLKTGRDRPLGRRAVQACPAVNGLERRLIELPAPFTLGLRCVRTHRGGFDLHLLEESTRPDDDIVDAFVTLMPRDTWRDAERPVVQIGYPIFFVSEQTCFVTQMPAWASPGLVIYPGPFIGGRFPTHLWPRSLNLSFEWADLSKPFRMRRGQPTCYLQVESDDPERPVQLVRATMGQELREYRARLEDVVKFTSNSFALIDGLAETRPATLLTEMS